jgi:hypothetical protein
VFGLAVWYAFESVVLRTLGCRQASRLERERLNPVIRSSGLQVLVFDAPHPWLERGLRSLVISSATLDLLDDRAVLGLVTQTVGQLGSASLAAELTVWLGNLPLLGAWVLDRWLAQLGRLLALAVGGSLVVPLLIWPTGFIRWVGRLFGAVVVGLLGSALLSSGLAAPGIGLLLAWALVPALRALLTWESRRAEAVADLATVEAGLGWQLLEALETLAFAESSPLPDGVLGLLGRRGSPYATRAERVWRGLSAT